ncbi:hypothetical protein F4804DRAFT_141127 [Jackrogersella minutella]|nr:hypothetical protein F4804DRAFT_141127 [Jackrogersella minutella]
MPLNQLPRRGRSPKTLYRSLMATMMATMKILFDSDNEFPFVEQIFDQSRKRKRDATDDGDTPCPPRWIRRKGRETNGSMVKEGLERVAQSMEKAERIAVSKNQSFNKAQRILMQSYQDQVSPEAIIGVALTWAKKDRLAATFLNLNDSFRLLYLKKFEQSLQQVGSPDGPPNYMEAALEAGDGVGARRPDDYNPEDDMSTESGSDFEL